jgi:hypothetical protein
VKVEIDIGRQTISIDDVVMSLELLKSLVNPDPLKMYSFVRRADLVIITEEYDLAAARRVTQA